jgi:hypothetical protein
MSFLDKLGGLAGGLAGGLGQVQQQQEMQRRSTLDQRRLLLEQMQQERLAEQAELAKAQTIAQSWEEGVDLDPNDETFKFAVAKLGSGMLVKNPQTGRPMKKKTPQQQLAEIQAHSAELNQPLEAAQRDMQMGDVEATKSFIEEMSAQYGPDFRKRLMNASEIPLETRRSAGQMLYQKPNLFLSREELLRTDPQYLTGMANAAAMGSLRANQSADIGINNEQVWAKEFDSLAEGNVELARMKMRDLNGYLAAKQKYVEMRRGQSGAASASVPGGRKIYDMDGNLIQQ